jgi:hypothetical protein
MIFHSGEKDDDMVLSARPEILIKNNNICIYLRQPESDPRTFEKGWSTQKRSKLLKTFGIPKEFLVLTLQKERDRGCTLSQLKCTIV